MIEIYYETSNFRFPYIFNSLEEAITFKFELSLYSFGLCIHAYNINFYENVVLLCVLIN